MPTSAPIGTQFNGNLVCAVDVETTGLKVGIHDIWEMCVLPLDLNYKPNKAYKPWNHRYRIKRPENVEDGALRLTGMAKADLMVTGIDPWKAADDFEVWFDKLSLKPGKKIIPLASNWPFDREFIKEWLGQSTFDYVFHGHYRDTQPIASFIQDRADHQREAFPFGRIGLASLCEKLGIDNGGPHRALYDCMASAEVYAALLRLPKI